MLVKCESFGAVVAEIAINPSKIQTHFFGEYKGDDGIKSLYFSFNGKGRLDKFINIILE